MTTEKDAALPDVLIIDDDNTVVMAVHKMLSGVARMRFANSGTQALSMLAQKAPDLVLLDVQLPDIDGLALCNNIRAEASTAEVPVLIITGDKEVGIEDRVFDAGANDLIPKPLHPRVVRARVAAHLKRRQ